MFKIKALCLGMITEITVFLVLMSAIALSAQSFGNILSSVYIICVEIAAVISVMVSAFVSSRCAFEKGVLYGVTMAVLWIILRVIFALIFIGEIIIPALLFNALILIGFGFLGGALGVSKRKIKLI